MDVRGTYQRGGVKCAKAAEAEEKENPESGGSKKDVRGPEETLGRSKGGEIVAGNGASATMRADQ